MSTGVLPQFLLEKVPAMMGCEGGVLSPSHDGLEELDLNSGMKKKLRRSFGGKTVPSGFSFVINDGCSTQRFKSNIALARHISHGTFAVPYK